MATASSFAVFGIGGFILGTLILPIVALCIRNPSRRLRIIRRLVGGSMRGFVYYMKGVGVLRYRIDGLHHVDPAQNYLIIANHPSLIDVVFLLAWFPSADCIIKGALFDSFFVR